MKAYIISIAVSTVICAVINMITPEKWSKYVGVVTGLVVTICIAQPIIRLVNEDVFKEVSYTTELTTKEGEKALYTQIKNELESRINNDVAARLKADFGRDCEAITEVEMSEIGEVTGVRKILVYGDKIDAVVIGDLRQAYGAEEVRYIGIKKTAEKSE